MGRGVPDRLRGVRLRHVQDGLAELPGSLYSPEIGLPGRLREGDVLGRRGELRQHFKDVVVVVEMSVHPRDLNGGEGLAQAIEWALSKNPRDHAELIRKIIPSFDGASNLARYLARWLEDN